MSISGLPQVRSFLETFKINAKRKDGWVLMPNPKTRATMLALGYLKLDVKNDLFSLVETDYSNGPVPGYKVKSDIWIFGIMREGIEIYIELEVSHFSDCGDEIPTSYCISFHFSERTMTYPYKN